MPGQDSAGSAESGDESGGGGGRGALQLADGQHVFADPFSMRLLLQQFGSLARCPDAISAPVVQLQTYRQDDATRKRFRALAHLPPATAFSLAELDLSSVLSAEVLQPFNDEIQKRKKERQRRKAAEEREARADAQRSEKERRKHGKSALAIELQMVGLTPAERKKRQEQLLADLPDVKVSGEWQDRWEQRESERQQQDAPSFARMVEAGFGAAGPAVNAVSPPMGPRSPLSPAWRVSPGPGPPAAWLAPAATPPAASAPSRGTSLLRGAATAEPPPGDVDDAELGSSPPSLGAGWATAPLLDGAIGAGAGAKAKKKKKGGVTLLSNSGGRQG